MKRIHRRNLNERGHVHSLTFSCYQRLPLLDSDRARLWLAESVNRAKVTLDFSVWAYVFMPEHVHLIVYPRLPVYDIAKIRSAIKEPVGRRALNYFRTHEPNWLPKLQRDRGGRTESLFWQSGGGYDRNIDTASTLMKTINYLHLNPVRRGLVRNCEEWKWSSAVNFAEHGTSPVELDSIPMDWLETRENII